MFKLDEEAFSPASLVEAVDEPQAPEIFKSLQVQRPEPQTSIFSWAESEMYSREMTPIEHQRASDGTPITIGGPTALRPPEVPVPAGPNLVLKGVASRPKPATAPRLSAEDVVKSFLGLE